MLSLGTFCSGSGPLAQVTPTCFLALPPFWVLVLFSFSGVNLQCKGYLYASPGISRTAFLTVSYYVML